MPTLPQEMPTYHGVHLGRGLVVDRFTMVWCCSGRACEAIRAGVEERSYLAGWEGGEGGRSIDVAIFF